jgi:hypothetical protein
MQTWYADADDFNAETQRSQRKSITGNGFFYPRPVISDNYFQLFFADSKPLTRLLMNLHAPPVPQYPQDDPTRATRRHQPALTSSRHATPPTTKFPENVKKMHEANPIFHL